LHFCCAVCGGSLQREQGSLRCQKGHCYDFARSGYVNLLPSNRKHAKLPGDNKEMVAARSRFLQGGYYAPLQQALCEQVRRFIPKQGDPVLLDAGCGEGYYTAAVASAAYEKNPSCTVLGVDISKSALALAAKRERRAEFAVASVFSLPLPDDSVDVLTEVFAPFCREEYLRVLKKEGILLEVIPAARHLFGLKAVLYDSPYENRVKPYDLEDFCFLGKTEVSGTIRVANPADIQALFAMTPYAYRTPPEAAKRLHSLSALETETSFEILAYRAIKQPKQKEDCFSTMSPKRRYGH